MNEVPDIEMDGVREYGDEVPVRIGMRHGRIVIIAASQVTGVHSVMDLRDVLDWLKANMPELLDEAMSDGYLTTRRPELLEEG